MAFVAGLIAPLVGLGELGLVGEAIVGVGLSFGISYLSRALQPKTTTSSAASGMQLSLSYNPNEARRIPFGVSADAGALAYHNVYGPNGNDYVQMVYRLGDVECDSLVKIYANGESLTLGSHVSNSTVSGYTVNQYPNAMWVEFHNGDWDQAADTDLVAHGTGGEFHSSYRGRGICYVRITMKFDAKLFKNGIPAFVFVFKGVKLYDWRKDSTAGGSGSHRWGNESTYEWTDNPAVCLYNWYRGITVNGQRVGGMNVPAVALPLDVWTAAANACDENVSLKAGGTEKRYRMGGTVFVDSDNTTVVRDMVTSMAGSVADCGGVLKLYAGVSQASVLSITDEDIMWNQAVKYVPKKSRASLVNAVFGSFNDPKQLYQSTALPPRISPDDETADGGFQLTENYGLTYVSSGTQGQRITEILRRQGRYQRNLTLTLEPAALLLEAGDWITWTSDRYGFESMLFRVVQATVNADGTVPVELVEVSNDIFAWNPSVDELDPQDPATVGSGNDKFVTVQNPFVEGILLHSGPDSPEDAGEQIPALHVTWTPVTDVTVVNLVISYRKVGSTVAMKRTVLDPSFGEDIITAGVQGGVQYEIQIDMVTLPKRATVATAWTPMANTTKPTVVGVAALANDIADGIVTKPKLSEQVLFELQLATDKAEIQNSVKQQISDAYDWAVKASETALSAKLDGYATGARLTQEITQRSDDDTALASSVQTAITWINDNAATVTEVIESLNGVSARWGIAVQVVNGQHVATGLVQLDGTAEETTFSILADKLVFADPNIPGSPLFQVVTVAEDPDTPGLFRMVLNGELIANAIRAGTVQIENLKALSSAFGDMTCSGIQRSANGKKVINWDTGQEWTDA